MHMEVRQVTSQGDFVNAVMRDPRLHTDYRVVLAVISRKGMEHNRRY